MPLPTIVSLVVICVLAFCGTAAAQNADTDGDGVIDAIDACDTQPGVAEFLGCPTDDSDGDGIGSTQGDLCPSVPGPAPNGCPPDPGEQPEPEAKEVEAGKLSVERRGARLSLYGQPFRPKPSGLFTPRTLTVWVPEGVSLLAGKVQTCTKAQARRLTIDTNDRCPQFGFGRLNAEDGLEGWFALPGPKQGNKRPVWLRTRDSDNFTDGFETGVIQKASGAYGTKLLLRFGGLKISTRAAEVSIGRLREEGKCPSGGWRFKLKTETEQGAGTPSRGARPARAEADSPPRGAARFAGPSWRYRSSRTAPSGARSPASPFRTDAGGLLISAIAGTEKNHNSRLVR